MEIKLQLDLWAEINEDMLYEIAQRIDSFVDYIRFRSTCKNWYANLPDPKYFKYPLLLLPSDDKKSDSLRQIFHPEEKRVIDHLSLPEAKDTLFRGSCYGWLITVGLDDTIRMLNPITRVEIHLPPISTLPTVVSYQPEVHDKEYTLNFNDLNYDYEKWFMQRAVFRKIILSFPPDDENQDFMAMAIAVIGANTNLCYCRRGDKIWTRLTDYSTVFFSDAIFYKGKMCAVDPRGSIYEFDMKTSLGGLSRTPSFDYNKLPYVETHNYLVQSNDGLLLVVRYIEREEYILEEEGEEHIIEGGDMLNGEHIQEEEGDAVIDHEELHTRGFSVLKLDESQNKWLEIKNLNDYVLVLGYNSSVCMLPHPISRNKGNRIYYSDDSLEFQLSQINGGYDNGIFNLEDGTIHPLFDEPNLICPAPIWLL